MDDKVPSFEVSAEQQALRSINANAERPIFDKKNIISTRFNCSWEYAL